MLMRRQLIKQLSATPTLLAQNAPHPPLEVLDPQMSLQANKATFFFRLVSFNRRGSFLVIQLTVHQERELEKVNAFYLQKEAEVLFSVRS